jgi:hypothetical protein
MEQQNGSGAGEGGTNQARSGRVTRSPEQWRALIQAQPASGLGVEDYCRLHQLTSSCFYRWRRFLAGSPTASSPWMGQKKNRPSATPTGFAAVRVLPEARPLDEPIRLRLATGRELLLPASIGMDRLAELVMALDAGPAGPNRGVS